LLSFSPSKRRFGSVGEPCLQPATSSCEGCSQTFCSTHWTEHRRSLDEQIDVLIQDLEVSLDKQALEVDLHPLKDEIDQWEKESIAKIDDKAKELRRELSALIDNRNHFLSTEFRELSKQLHENRESDNFIESDLRQWTYALAGLKVELQASLALSLDARDDSSLVKQISIATAITNESFERVSDNGRVQLEHYSRVAVHAVNYGYVEVRGKNEYLSHRYTIRMLIEQSADSWTFLDIATKSITLQDRSHLSRSTYGWTNNNYYWLNGQCHSNRTSTPIELKTKDILRLVLDCDQHQISLINERTNTQTSTDRESRFLSIAVATTC
jgi:hypothetical protein